MLGAIFLIALTAAPPPPPVRSVVYPDRYGIAARRSGPPIDLVVTITAAGRPLWTGPMRISSSRSALFRQNKSDAPAGECAVGNADRQTDNALSIAISPRTYTLEATTYQMDVTWTRPAEDARCDHPNAGGGSRTVTLSETLNLSGPRTVVRGDAGLVIEVARR